MDAGLLFGFCWTERPQEHKGPAPTRYTRNQAFVVREGGKGFKKSHSAKRTQARDAPVEEQNSRGEGHTDAGRKQEENIQQGAIQVWRGARLAGKLNRRQPCQPLKRNNGKVGFISA